MNLLAHIYLSGDEDLIKIGNFIGDYVKGKQYKDYTPLLQKGILLHRGIDQFTDHHTLPKEIKRLLRPSYHKHAGIVVDIFYDHFLTKHWENFSDIPLHQFIQAFHQTLRIHFKILPASVQSFVPRMIEHKRLLSYGDKEGVRKALQIMAEHTSLPDNDDYAISILTHYYKTIYENFLNFFPQLIEYVKKKISV